MSDASTVVADVLQVLLVVAPDRWSMCVDVDVGYTCRHRCHDPAGSAERRCSHTCHMHQQGEEEMMKENEEDEMETGKEEQQEQEHASACNNKQEQATRQHPPSACAMTDTCM